MCLLWLILVLFGPRIVNVGWWLFQASRWQATFGDWIGAWWIWPALGILFLPWTTLMYVSVGLNGLVGIDWLWIVLGLLADLSSTGGGLFRERIPGWAK